MKKLLNKLTIILSFVLLISTILTPVSHAESLDNKLEENDFVIEVYDEELDDNIKLYLLYAENGKSRVQGLNSEKEIIYDYSFDVSNNSMTSELTGEVMDIEFPDVDLQEMSTTEPNYCNGSSYQNISYSVTQIAAGIVGTASIAAVTASLVGLIAATTGFKIAGSGLSVAAHSVFNAIMSGNFNKRVNFRINFVCSRMWESDPFHPGGGFYFYGWRYRDTTYLGLY